MPKYRWWAAHKDRLKLINKPGEDEEYSRKSGVVVVGSTVVGTSVVGMMPGLYEAIQARVAWRKARSSNKASIWMLLPQV